LIEKPFDNPEWLYEIKWDGYRAIAFVENQQVRLFSRNQVDLSSQYAELKALPQSFEAESAVLDGEIVALDAEGRPSFSLLQQRTGIRGHGRRATPRRDVSVAYYAFDLLAVNGYDLRQVPLSERKPILSALITPSPVLLYSDHFDDGIGLFAVAKQKGLEGIVAKRRASFYEAGRSRQWLKIKVTQTIDCVIGGYTDPEGSREHFGSLVLGLYNPQGQLVHVGQAGTGFTQATLKEIFAVLKALATARSPFQGEVDARKVHWVKPETVAEIKFSEWTHETAEGGYKLRAPVFLGLRRDKKARECTFADQKAGDRP
jgi:bifunctional non-homologous end joining protein LigD